MRYFLLLFVCILYININAQTVCADLDGDNYVSTSDLLEFLSQFGTYCFANSACDNANSINYHGVDYALVSIGDQCWFSENLRTSKYLNGDQIIYAPNDVDWTTHGSNQNGAFAIYDNNLQLKHYKSFLNRCSNINSTSISGFLQ